MYGQKLCVIYDGSREPKIQWYFCPGSFTLLAVTSKHSQEAFFMQPAGGSTDYQATAVNLPTTRTISTQGVMPAGHRVSRCTKLLAILGSVAWLFTGLGQLPYANAETGTQPRGRVRRFGYMEDGSEYLGEGSREGQSMMREALKGMRSAERKSYEDRHGPVSDKEWEAYKAAMRTAIGKIGKNSRQDKKDL
jgi:hypothetical protein